MKSVFIVHHLHVLPSELEDIKIIGIYRSMEASLAAIDKLKSKNGFRDYPDLVNPEIEQSKAQGFYIDEYQLDVNHWEEGYVSD